MVGPCRTLAAVADPEGWPGHGGNYQRVGQRQVADKRGENTALRPLLSGLRPGTVLTLDALHTNKKTAR
jgi:hypothetical protein